jgi:acetate kinase
MKILVLNSGSSSEKCCVYEIADKVPALAPRPLWEAEIEWSGSERGGAGTANLEITDASGAARKGSLPIESRREAVEHLLNSLREGAAAAVGNFSEIGVVGHRVVHGGVKFVDPVIVTAAVKKGILEMAAFAPLHNKAELEGMEVVESVLGAVPQVAVFDTAFHHHLPQAAAVYPGPYSWWEKDGIRRYGFHGINHQYCAERAAQLLKSDSSAGLKLVSCHLGNGCSLAAIDGGRSVDTTMGFTPLEGLMMGTRSGSIDPAIVTYLIRQQGSTADQVDRILNEQSGLLGISGLSSDMREILNARKSGNSRAQLAFDIFVHRLRTGIGAMAAALGGIDALIFTAGIGEHSLDVRAAACAGFDYLGVSIDVEKNQASPVDADIAGKNSRVRILVIRAQEDWAIARFCWTLISADRTASAA